MSEILPSSFGGGIDDPQAQPSAIPDQAQGVSSMLSPDPLSNATRRAVEQQPSRETLSILHELDLGHHSLFIMSDGSIDLLDDEQAPIYLADNVLSLNQAETYRLFIALQEQFKHSLHCSSLTESQ